MNPFSLLLLLFVASTQGINRYINLDEKSANYIVNAKVGDQIIVTVKSAPSTGYYWYVKQPVYSIYDLDSENFVPPSGSTVFNTIVGGFGGDPSGITLNVPVFGIPGS